MSIDRRALCDELTQGIIYYLYTQDCPSLHEPTTAAQFAMYRNNPIFRAKAECLVASIMTVIEKHIEVSDG